MEYPRLNFSMMARKGSCSNLKNNPCSMKYGLRGWLTIGNALSKVENNHVWPPFLDLKNSIPEVGYPTHTHIRDL